MSLKPLFYSFDVEYTETFNDFLVKFVKIISILKLKNPLNFSKQVKIKHCYFYLSNSASDDNSMCGLKFSFEPQGNIYPPATLTPLPDIKDSPPSSPGSEAGSKKRSSAANTNDVKDYKLFPKGVTATHMLGNQLNPASSVAQKMTDQLYMEIEEHSAYTSSSIESSTPLTGPTFPGKHLNNVSVLD